MRAVGDDDLLAVLPVGTPRRARAIDVAVLADENWIAGCPRCRGHLLELCARAGFEPHIAFETDNFVAVEGLVAQGIGVATLPRLAVASFPQLPGVVTLPLPPAEARTIHVVTAHGADRVPPVRATLDAIAAGARRSQRGRGIPQLDWAGCLLHPIPAPRPRPAPTCACGSARRRPVCRTSD